MSSSRLRRVHNDVDDPEHETAEHDHQPAHKRDVVHSAGHHLVDEHVANGGKHVEGAGIAAPHQHFAQLQRDSHRVAGGLQWLRGDEKEDVPRGDEQGAEQAGRLLQLEGQQIRAPGWSKGVKYFKRTEETEF